MTAPLWTPAFPLTTRRGTLHQLQGTLQVSFHESRAGQRTEKPLSGRWVPGCCWVPLSRSGASPTLNRPNFGGRPQSLQLLSCSPAAGSLTLLQQHPPPNPASLKPWGNQASPPPPMSAGVSKSYVRDRSPYLLPVPGAWAEARPAVPVAPTTAW